MRATASPIVDRAMAMRRVFVNAAPLQFRRCPCLSIVALTAVFTKA